MMCAENPCTVAERALGYDRRRQPRVRPGRAQHPGSDREPSGRWLWVGERGCWSRAGETRGAPPSCPRGARLLSAQRRGVLPAGPGLPAALLHPAVGGHRGGWHCRGSLGRRDEGAPPLRPPCAALPQSLSSTFRGGILGWRQVLGWPKAETGVAFLSPAVQLAWGQKWNSS